MSKVFWNLDDWPREPGERVIARGEVGGVPWELAIIPHGPGHHGPVLYLWSPFNGSGVDLAEGPIVGHGPGSLDGVPESEGGGYLVSAQVAVDARSVELETVAGEVIQAFLVDSPNLPDRKVYIARVTDRPKQVFATGLGGARVCVHEFNTPDPPLPRSRTNRP